MVLTAPVGLLVAVMVTLPSEPEELAPVIEPVFTHAVEGRQARTQDVVVSVSLASAPEVLVGPAGADAVVTERLVAVGDPVADGDVVAVVGSMPVVALQTPRPFHRSLARGDRGPDVVMLQDHLRRGGWSDGESDGVFGPATAEAVLAWRQDVGDPGASRAFDLGQVLWLADPIDAVAVSGYRVGAAPPAAGQVALQGRPTVDMAVVQDGTRGPVDAAANVSLVLGDIDLGPVDDVDLSGTQLRQLTELLEAGDLDHLELEQDTDTESGPDSPSSDGSDERLFDAQLRGRSAQLQVSVPGAAVLDDGGRTCVLVATAGGGTEPVVVTVVGGSLDTVLLRPDPNLTDRDVLVNPLDVVGDPSCG